MIHEEFKEYLAEFENKVIARGLVAGVLGEVKLIPIRQGRFSKSKFAKLLGSFILTDESVVVDYYGYLKKSYGFYVMVQEKVDQLEGRQVRLVDAPVIHFSRVKMEHLVELAPELVVKFPKFKKRILEAKDFPKRKV